MNESNGLPLDTAGRPITPSRLRRAMNLNIAVGIGGVVWYTVCGPAQIMQVFFRNHLGATDSELGLLVALSLLAAPFNLAAVFIYSRLPTRKTFWAVASTIHRLYGFVLAGVSIYVAQGGSQSLGAKVILGSAAVSWALVTSCSSGWWSWMADLVPERIRATFFGRRSAIIRAFNMVWLFAATVALDAIGFVDIFYVYAVIFTIGGVVGILDILIHCLIPEPRRPADEPKVGWREFAEPARNRNFITFALTIGLWYFSMGVFGPFVWPYITAADRIGAPQTWMGITIVISQLAAIATLAPWGIVMDRFGRKPAVLLGCLTPLTWIAYFFLTPNNYPYILPATALVSGVLQPGIITGVQQLMLTLTPPRNRTTYVAWYSATVGMIAAGGPLLGGVFKDALGDFQREFGGFTFTAFHVVGLASLVLCALTVLMLARIREGKEKPVGFVVSRLFTPGVFRTFLNISTIGFASTGERAARALRTLDGSSSDLALTDTIPRLDDPDHEVREEAARALGRIGSAEAVQALIEQVRDPDSTIRPHAARALGRIGDPGAVPVLIEGLASDSEELQDACAQALGAIGGRESVHRLMDLLRERRTERVIVSGAEAVSKHGILEAAWEIVPRMHETRNPVLRRQLAIATGNLLGRPGEFYEFLTGERAREGARLGRLFRGARRALASFHRAAPGAGQQAADSHRLVADLQRIRGLMEGQSYRSAVEGLYEIVRELVRLATGRVCPDDVAQVYAFARDAKLGLGFWFVTDVKRRMGLIDDPELLHMDALLALYFLSAYRLPQKSPPA